MTDPLDFFRKRGIDPNGAVFHARGYTRFDSYEDLLDKVPAFGDMQQKDGRVFDVESNWLNRGAQGWVFPRCATAAAEDPLPQIRVDVAPIGDRTYHRHSGFMHVEGCEYDEDDPDGAAVGCGCGAKTPHKDLFYVRAYGRKRLRAHLAKEHPEGHGIDVEKLHPWVCVRQFGILAHDDVPEGEPVPDFYDVGDGVKAWLWSLGHGGVHAHWEEKKYLLPVGPQGRRLDHNPSLTERDFIEAERIWFVLEGVAKTDALTQAGEIAFGVPSVTCWIAPELDDWLRRLPHVPILILVDSDWVTNDDVRTQAYLCREYLRSRGFAEAEVVAPPPRKVRDGKGSDKAGADDHLGELGLNVGDLILYPGATPDVSAVPERKTRGPWRQRYDSKAFALRWLQIFLPPGHQTWLSEEGKASSITVAAHRRLLEGGFSADTFWGLKPEARKAALEQPAQNLRNALHALQDDDELICYLHDSKYVPEKTTRGRKAETIVVDGRPVEIPAVAPYSIGTGYENGAPIIKLTEPIQHGRPLSIEEWEIRRAAGLGAPS